MAQTGSRPRESGRNGWRPEDPVATVTLRPIGSPLALGFLGLAGGTFVLAGLQLHWVAAGQSHAAAMVLLAFVFPTQALSAVYGFLARDTVAGTGMGVLAATWLTLGAVTATSPAGRTSGAAGLLLMMAALALLVPVVASGTDKLVASLVMVGTSVRFVLTGAWELSARNSWESAAGIAGVVLAGIALYAALALEVEDKKHRTVLPTFRRGAGREAFYGDVAEELKKVIKEAGVRREL